MRIECTIRRPGGTPVMIEKKSYHFRPTETDARHTAEVTDEDHIQTFLAIKEAYRIARDTSAAPAAGGLGLSGEAPVKTAVAAVAPVTVPQADAGDAAAATEKGDTQSIPKVGLHVGGKAGKYQVFDGEKAVSPAFKSEKLAIEELERLKAAAK